MASSLGRRLTTAFIVVGLGSALLTAVLVNRAFGDRFASYLEQQRTARELQLGRAVLAAFEPGGGWQRDRLDGLAPLVAMAGVRVRLLDRSGNLVWSPSNAQMGPGMARMHRQMTSAGPLLPVERVPLRWQGRPVGSLMVRLPQGTVPVADRAFRDSVNWLLGLGGLVAGTVGVGVGLVFARRTLRPVTELTSAARDLRAGNRSRRAAVRGDDEIAQMARAFNDLVDSVDREDAVRKAFAADVAHELRTPLAVLRSHLEAVLDGVVEPSPALLGSLHEEILRMGRLTADLETMTSADSVEFDLHRRRVDLAQIVSGAAAGLRHRFEEGGLDLAVHSDPAVVLGDETRLRQVATNLLTNALKFVPPPGRVTVATRRVDGWAELVVSDDGPGIPSADLQRVFERFYRGPQVRTGGSGIGLAVVHALVNAHGGEVSASNVVGGGACFRVRLPYADAEEPPAADGESAPARSSMFTRPSQHAPTIRCDRVRRSVRPLTIRPTPTFFRNSP